MDRRIQLVARSAYAAAVWFLALCALLLAVHSGVLQWQYRNLVPQADMIHVVSFFDLHPSAGLWDFFHFRDNEHRPVIPLYLFKIDHDWFGARGTLLFPILFIAMGALALASVSWIWGAKLDRELRILIGSVVLAIFFWEINYENLTWEKQIHELLSLLLLVLACLCAARVGADATSVRKRDLSNSLAAGVLASMSLYCFLFGAVAFPVILIHGLLARWRWSSLGLFAAFGAAALGLYALVYIKLDFHTDPIDALFAPWQLTLYVGSLLGAPLPRFTLAPALVVWSAVAIVSFIALARYLGGRDGRDDTSNRLSDFCVLLIACALGIALLTGLGRLTINDGLDSRYAVIACLFWIGVFGLLTVRSGRNAKLAAPGVSALILLLILASTPGFDSIIRDRAQNTMLVAVAAEFGVHDWPIVRPRPEIAQGVWTHLRHPYPSFNDSEPFVWLGKDINDRPKSTENQRCFGNIDAIASANDKFHFVSVTGWGFGQGRWPLVWVALVDSGGKIVGLGRTGLERNDVAEETRATKISSGARTFSGFRALARAEQGEQLSLWLVDSKGNACFAASKRFM